jgi:hypothetical protein
MSSILFASTDSTRTQSKSLQSVRPHTHTHTHTHNCIPHMQIEKWVVEKGQSLDGVLEISQFNCKFNS